jgi:cation diffusion facilitator CzcD-associated flavoprotein CzcO
MTQRRHDEAVRPRRYCVIGAGAAGLAAVKALIDQNLEVDCYEQTNRVAGHWHTDYECLHLITPRPTSGFAGFPMPEAFPLFPSRDDMRSYIESFAEQQGLLSYIRFGERVDKLTPIGPAGSEGWQVATSNGRNERYDAVLVANGHLWSPRIPEIGQDYAGTQMHSSQYRNRRDLVGGRVLVVGAGNSGCDLAVDAAQAGAETYIAMRRGQVFQPKTFFGLPRSELPFLARLPAWLQERILRYLVVVNLGKARNYKGMPTPASANLNRQPPVVNSQLLYWIHHGRITVTSAVRAIDGVRVTFEDGGALSFDTILWATGFKACLPFLDPSLIRTENDIPLRLAGGVVPIGLSNIFLIGMIAPRGPQLPVYSAQSELVALHLRFSEATNWVGTDYLTSGQQPVARIDVLRHEWERQMQQMRRRMDRKLRSAGLS